MPVDHARREVAADHIQFLDPDVIFKPRDRGLRGGWLCPGCFARSRTASLDVSFEAADCGRASSDSVAR